MIKRMTLLVRKDELSFAEFKAYWWDHHGPIVNGMPTVSGYLQNPIAERLIPRGDQKSPFTLDGIVELWFPDQEALAKAFETPAAKSLPDDELNFIRGITIYAIEEKELKPGGGSGKIMLLGSNCSDASLATIEKRVVDLPGVNRAVVNRALKIEWRDHLWHEPSPPEFIVELRLDSVAGARELIQTPEFKAMEDEFESRSGVLAGYLVDERRVI